MLSYFVGLKRSLADLIEFFSFQRILGIDFQFTVMEQYVHTVPIFY